MDSSVPDPAAVPGGLIVHRTEWACINPWLFGHGSAW